MPSVYIHIPFCLTKCTYCNFYSVTRCGELPLFLDCLRRELRLRAADWTFGPLSSLYVGGGTPSLLSPGEIQRLLEEVAELYGLQEGAEITLEANPNHLTEDYVRTLRDTAINRLSIGVQSLSDEVLRRIRRQHTARQAEDALAFAEKYGFTNLSADLIYGLPGSSLAQWERDVRRLSRLPHLSCYQLTLEEGSALQRQCAKGLERLPSEEETDRQFACLLSLLSEAGFTRYEVSNFCKGEAWSRHNMAYWEGEPYFGFGPGAHSFVPHRRRWNVADVARYAAALSVPVPTDTSWYEEELLTPDMEYEEYVMLGLRTFRGCELERVRRQWGEERLRHLLAQLRLFPASHYRLSAGRLVLTEEGLRFADAVAASLFV
ncbi:MAG: radical SAM family heme chaperone HemW [Bacteroidales bacterium]|nr:radical SAM family heme chaperone HemW [Bacteroidales bacterium]